MSDEDMAASVLADLSPSRDSPATKGSKATKVAAKKQAETKKGQKKAPRKYNKRSKEDPKFPVAPRVVQVIKKPKTYIDHSYRDFSSVPAEMAWEEPTDIANMSFSEKVQDILSNDDYSKCISWMPHGRSFRIDVPVMFERKICEKYFSHKRYSSFLRQLNTHGFKHLTQGNDRNTYYHEFFLRGLPHLCKYMPEARDARRLIPDPENEPSFNTISNMWPVPLKKQSESDFQQAQQQQAQQQQAQQQHNHQQLVNSLVGAPRLASEVGWIMDTSSMPLSKRQMLLSSAASLLQQPVAVPTLPPQLSAPPTRISGWGFASLGAPALKANPVQQAASLLTNTNNSTLAVASLRAQLEARAQLMQAMEQPGAAGITGHAPGNMSIGDWLRSQHR